MILIESLPIETGFSYLTGKVGEELHNLTQNLPIQASFNDTFPFKSNPRLAGFVHKLNRSQFDRPYNDNAGSGRAESLAQQFLLFRGPLPAQGFPIDATELELPLEQSTTRRDFLTGMVADASVVDDLHSRITRRAGRAENQANQIVQADFARPLFEVNGAGVTVGVISDSYNFLGGAAADIASGDLPPNVTVLKEGAPVGGENPVDEGRAMMQLIHDIAPGARLLFYSAGRNEAELATAIRALANAGANIIVDDIVFAAQPFFLDGPAAQAVNEVAARGVAYFSAAGNESRDAYESPFRESGIRFSPDQLPLSNPANFTVGRFEGGFAHDFDPGPGVDIYQRFTLGSGESFQVSFQWDQPFASVTPGRGALNDIDIYVVNAAQNQVLGGSTDNNIGRDPIEEFVFRNNTGVTADFNFLILRNEGATPGLMRSLFLDDVPILQEFATNSPTIYGHSNAALGAGVGAVDYRTPSVLQSFSSAGPTPIFFDPAGNRLPIPDIRQQPRFVAPDNVDTTFLGSDVDRNGFPNFRGTSASAPNTAAVAALMLQVTPGTNPLELYTALGRGAIDIGVPGFDSDSGFGLIQADRAVGILRLFDPNFYLAMYPDVAQAVTRGAFRSGLQHFLEFGQFEGRNPSSRFSNRVYLAENPDVAAAVARGAFSSGFQHYIQFGQVEGRDRTTLFDREFYVAQYPDVALAITSGTFRSAFEQFTEAGQAQRRNPNAFFDDNFYLTQNPDVAQAVTSGIFRSGFDHFLKAGQFERRNPSSLFNTNFYLARNPDVAQALAGGVIRSPFEHFFRFGRFEGRVARLS